MPDSKTTWYNGCRKLSWIRCHQDHTHTHCIRTLCHKLVLFRVIDFSICLGKLFAGCVGGGWGDGWNNDSHHHNQKIKHLCTVANNTINSTRGRPITLLQASISAWWTTEQNLCRNKHGENYVAQTGGWYSVHSFLCGWSDLHLLVWVCDGRALIIGSAGLYREPYISLAGDACLSEPSHQHSDFWNVAATPSLQKLSLVSSGSWVVMASKAC